MSDMNTSLTCAISETLRNPYQRSNSTHFDVLEKKAELMSFFLMRKDWVSIHNYLWQSKENKERNLLSLNFIFSVIF